MSTDPLNAGLAGMEAASIQIDVSANNIANVGTPGYQAEKVEFDNVYAGAVAARISANSAPGGLEPAAGAVPGIPEPSNVDMAAEIIKMNAGQAAYAANAKSVRTGDQILKTAVDIDTKATKGS